MSGSSVDGLDFSLIKSDGEKNVEIITNKFFEFEINFRQQVFMLIDEFNARSNKNISVFVCWPASWLTGWLAG